MRYLLALFLPWLAFFSMGMIGSGIICLILQLTIIGWLPAAIWAFFAINNFYADRRNDAAAQSDRKGRRRQAVSRGVSRSRYAERGGGLRERRAHRRIAFANERNRIDPVGEC